MEPPETRGMNKKVSFFPLLTFILHRLPYTVKNGPLPRGLNFFRKEYKFICRCRRIRHLSGQPGSFDKKPENPYNNW